MAASRFVHDNALPGPLFNDYLSGSYLVWDLQPDYRVFYDPRFRPYPREFRDDYFRLTKSASVADFEAYFRKYPARTAVVDHQVAAPLARRFRDSPDWTLVFLGPVAAVFVRSDVVPPTVALQIEGNTDPRRFLHSKDGRLLGSLANLMLKRDPGFAVDLLRVADTELPRWSPARTRLLGGVHDFLDRVGWTSDKGERLNDEQMNARFAGFYLAGDLESARIVGAAYLIHHSDDPVARYNLACVESRLGNHETAVWLLDRALRDGYAKPEKLFTDDDLAGVRGTPAFASLVEDHGLRPVGVGR